MLCTRMKKVAHVFVDANVTLHFNALNGLDWCAVCDSQTVLLHVTQPLLAELNKIKDSGPNPAIRERAKATLRQLKSLYAGEKDSLPANVRVQFSEISPDVAKFPGLNPHVADDVLLAAVLLFKKSFPDEEVFVATDDDGFGLIVKCGHWGLKVIEPPETLRLPAAEDKRDAQLRRLREENEKLRNTGPRLRLHFTDNEAAKLEFSLKQTDVDSEAGSMTKRLREDYPDLQATLPTPGVPGLNLRQSMNTPDAVQKYNSALKEFFERCQKPIRELVKRRSRTIFFGLSVTNSGSAPAENLSLKLHFPDGFALSQKEKWDRTQTKGFPHPPEKPDHVFTRLASLGDPSHHLTSGLIPVRNRPPGPELWIEKTGSYEVAFTHPKLRQGDTAPLAEFVLTFEKHPFSFEVPYQIVADNLPKILSDKLYFVHRT